MICNKRSLYIATKTQCSQKKKKKKKKMLVVRCPLFLPFRDKTAFLLPLRLWPKLGFQVGWESSGKGRGHHGGSLFSSRPIHPLKSPYAFCTWKGPAVTAMVCHMIMALMWLCEDGWKIHPWPGGGGNIRADLSPVLAERVPCPGIQWSLTNMI